MIDFVNPRSRVRALSIILSMLSLVLLVTGSLLLYTYGKPYLVAKTTKSPEVVSNVLPSGDDLVLQRLDAEALDALEQLAQDEEAVIREIGELPTSVAETLPESQEAVVANPTTVVVAESEGLVTQDTTASVQQATVSAHSNIPQGNRLVVPQMLVDGEVIQSLDESALLNGIWHIPGTAQSPEEGNLVLSAHRYYRKAGHPESFWKIDELVLGDRFTLYWEGKEYTYEVSEIKVVEPSQIDILYNTPEPQLTLFSCTPLFTSDQRHVVIAKPVTDSL